MRPMSELSSNMTQLSPPSRAVMEETDLDFIDDVIESSGYDNVVTPPGPSGDNVKSPFKYGVTSSENGVNGMKSPENEMKFATQGINGKAINYSSEVSNGKSLPHRKDTSCKSADSTSDATSARKLTFNKTEAFSTHTDGRGFPKLQQTVTSAIVEHYPGPTAIKTYHNHVSEKPEEIISKENGDVGSEKEQHYIPSEGTTACDAQVNQASTTQRRTSPPITITTLKPKWSLYEPEVIPTASRSGGNSNSLSPPPMSGPKLNVSEEDDDMARCPSFSLSVGSDCSSSAVDLQLQPNPAARVGEDNKTFTHRSVSQTNLPRREDSNDRKATPKLGESGRGEEVTSSKHDSQKEERNSLSMRISKSLGNFFQRVPTSSSPLSENVDSEGQGQKPKRAMQKSQRKDSKRRSSLAGKLMSSIAEWGRRGTNHHKNQPQQEENKLETTEAKSEYYEAHNNNRKTPLFVSFEEQTEIYDEEPVPLTEEQKKTLRESWVVIKNDVADVGVETFMGLFNTHPESIDSFLAFKDKSVEDIEQSAVLKAHALRVMQTVDKCVTRLEEVDKMANVLSQLGRRHVGYQANAELIPMIGKQFVSAIEPKMADKWSPELKAAWEALFHVINYNVRRGIMEEKHKRMDEAEEAVKRRY